MFWWMQEDTTHENLHLSNQVKSKIPIWGTIDPQKVNKHDIWYQCYKGGPDILFEKSTIRDK